MWWLGAAAQYLEAEAPDFKALIIRRDPKAVAFSCYKAAFANGERAWADKPEDLGARLHAKAQTRGPLAQNDARPGETRRVREID